jgi:hypothetical protein
LERIVTAPNGQQEFTLSLEALKLGHFVAGGVLDYQPTVRAAVDAGMGMVNHDPSNKWTKSQVTRKVVRRMRRGMEEPWDDGAALDVATEEVLRRYREDPKWHANVMELLREAEAKAEPPPEEPAAQPAAGSEQEHSEPPPHPWLKPGEQPLIRWMGQGAPSPVAFLIDGLLHEVGTGLMAGTWFGGKTYVGMSVAASVLTGKPFAGRSVLRKGGVLWLAAEGEREVDKRIRAAVKALGCDPDKQPICVQIASVPKLLSDRGEEAVMQIVRQAARATRAEFGVALVLVIIDTMIKAAGYKKSENDSVEVNNVIRVMDHVSLRAKCFVLAIDHMGKNEELGARGSSDKPSSVDVYAEITKNGRGRVLDFVKIKGEKGDEQITFDIVGTILDEGQKTAFVRWGEWSGADDAGPSLSKDATLLFQCVRDVIESKGIQLKLFASEPEVRCVKKAEIRNEFHRRRSKTKGADNMAFKRAWDDLVGADPPLLSTKENGKSHWDHCVFLEK